MNQEHNQVIRSKSLNKQNTNSKFAKCPYVGSSPKKHPSSTPWMLTAFVCPRPRGSSNAVVCTARPITVTTNRSSINRSCHRRHINNCIVTI